MFLSPGSIIKINGEKKINITPPHTEDFIMRDYYFHFVRQLEYPSFIKFIENKAFTSVNDAFENNIVDCRYVETGKGSRSLASVILKSIDFIDFIDDKEKHFGCSIKMDFTDQDDTRYIKIPVNDLYFFNLLLCKNKEFNEKTSMRYVIQIKDILNRTKTILRMGLTRSYKNRCWLQINGVHNIGFFKKYYDNGFRLSMDLLTD